MGTHRRGRARTGLAGRRPGVMVPGPVKGDLLVGLYFASLSLLLWLRSVWIVRARAVRSSGLGHLIALALGLGIGGTLIAADIITAGRL